MLTQHKIYYLKLERCLNFLVWSQERPEAKSKQLSLAHKLLLSIYFTKTSNVQKDNTELCRMDELNLILVSIYLL